MGEARAKKQRSCPAVGRIITASECAENRVSRHACPADCPFNPWRPETCGTIAELRERLLEKSLVRLRQDAEARGITLSPPDGEDELLWLAFLRHHLFVARDAAGRTVFDRWMAATSGLHNDERILLRAMAAARPAVLEFQQKVGDDLCRCRDLLRPDAPSLLVADGGLAQSPARFQRYYTLLFDLPHYAGIVDGAFHLSQVPGLEPRELFAALARWRGGLAPGQAHEDWLLANFVESAAALRAFEEALKDEILLLTNGPVLQLSYALLAPRSEIAERLDADAGFFRIQQDLTMPSDCEDLWELRELVPAPTEDAPADPAAAKHLWAGIGLSDGRLVLVLRDREHIAATRARFEATLGPLIALQSSEERNVAGELLAVKTPVRPEDAVPKELLEHAGVVAALDKIRLDAGWADRPEPVLDGATPRLAAVDAALRPRLVALLRATVERTDIEQHWNGGQTDPLTIVRDLGLCELDVPAPEGLYDPDRAPAGDPAPTLLSEKDVARRLDALWDDMRDMDALLELFEDDAPELFSLLCGPLSSGSGSAREILLNACAEAWGFYFFDQEAAHPPDLERIVRNTRLRITEDSFARQETMAHLPDRLRERARQPHLFAHLCVQALDMHGEQPEEDRCPVYHLASSLVHIAMVADEFDRLADLTEGG